MAELNEMNISDIVRVSELSHIAFIMDGNGRWAKKRGLPREAGHKVGAETFKRIMRYTKSIGIKCCTVYAFSTENIKRPKHEVNALFKIFLEYIAQAGDENDIEFRFIGEPAELTETIGRLAKNVEEESRGREYKLNIALNYGGRAEIVHAVNRLIRDGKKSVTEEDIDSALYTEGCPDPDLIVRTGGDLRISNFLLWQSAYSELYFTDVLWPDLTEADVDEAVKSFAKRKRRWGGLDKEDCRNG